MGVCVCVCVCVRVVGGNPWRLPGVIFLLIRGLEPAIANKQFNFLSTFDVSKNIHFYLG